MGGKYPNQAFTAFNPFASARSFLTRNNPRFTDRIRSLLKTHANSKRLGVISFMDVPGKNEPWIFFKVIVKNGTIIRVPISGNFGVTDPKAQPTAQMLSFHGNNNVDPAPIPNAGTVSAGFGVGTALLFRQDVASHLDDNLFPNAPDPAGAPEGIAFKHPAGISKVSRAVLPKDKWNVRAFGWGFNFFTDRGFKPTVTQRAANEAAESAALINSEFIEFKPKVPQPVAISKPAVTEPNLAR
jgi:hypothetical protein